MKDLTKGNVYKTFILFAIPLVLAGLLSQAYNLIDTIIAGRFLGNNALAAIGASSAFITFMSASFYGFGTGFSIYIAKLFGAKDYKRIKTSVFNNTLIVGSVSVFLSVIIIIFSDNILTMLRIDESIFADAKKYFVIYHIGFTFIALNYNYAIIMNALGISSYPFYNSLLSSVINIAGNLISIVVLGMGVEGIAISSVVAAVIVNIMYLFKLKKCFEDMGVSSQKMSIDFDDIKSSFSYTIPTFMQQIVMYIAAITVSPLVNGIGSFAAASYNVIMKIFEVNQAIYCNSSKTVSSYIAQSVGAGKKENINKGIKVGLLQGVVLLLPVLLACVIFAKPICGIFFPSGYSGASLDYSVIFMKYYLPFIMFNMVNNLFHSFYRGVAAMKILLFSTAIGSVVRIIASVILVDMYGFTGIFMGWVISWVVEMLFAGGIFISGIWKRDTV